MTYTLDSRKNIFPRVTQAVIVVEHLSCHPPKFGKWGTPFLHSLPDVIPERNI